MIARAAARLFAVVLSFTATARAADAPPAVSQTKDGKLAYITNDKGDRIPDFSTAGYLGGGVAIPDAPVRIVVPQHAGDSTARIQRAIDYVSSLQPDDHGI